jgi:TfoX/Sxy family transcriptional regulator of competence genes
MASSAATVEWIVKQLASAGEVSAKAMFGEYGIYCDGKIVALVCDDQLFVKRTDAGYAFWGEHQEGRPYKGAKPLMLLEEADMRDRTRLVELIRITQKHLPAQKKIKSKC